MSDHRVDGSLRRSKTKRATRRPLVRFVYVDRRLVMPAAAVPATAVAAARVPAT
jgi:hypothetical protein